MNSLEHETSRELDLTIAVSLHPSDFAKCLRIAHTAARIGELRRVEHVESVSMQFQIEAVREMHVLLHGESDRALSRPVDLVAERRTGASVYSNVVRRGGGWNIGREGSRIEPVSTNTLWI